MDKDVPWKARYRQIRRAYRCRPSYHLHIVVVINLNPTATIIHTSEPL